MIQTHFNLSRPLFPKDIKTKDLLNSEPRSELVARLEHVRKHCGLFLLTGAPGTGKTAALRAWVDDLPDTNHKLVYLPLSTISPFDLTSTSTTPLADNPFTVKPNSSRICKPLSRTGLTPPGACPSSSSTKRTPYHRTPFSNSPCFSISKWTHSIPWS